MLHYASFVDIFVVCSHSMCICVDLFGESTYNKLWMFDRRCWL